MHNYVFNQVVNKTFLCFIKNHAGNGAPDFEEEVEARNLNEALDKFLKMGLGEAGWGKEELKEHVVEASEIDASIDNEINDSLMADK